MAAFLQAINGKLKGSRFEVAGAFTRIGRHRDCEIHLDLDSVSRVHAQIVQEDGIVYIEDLKSKNKTFVNGDPIGAKTMLSENDRIRVAEVLFVYRSTELTNSLAERSSVSAVQDDTGSRVVSIVDASRRDALPPSVKPEIKLKAILEISEAVSQTFEIELVFDKVLDRLLHIFPQMDRGLVILLDEVGKLTPRATKHRKGVLDTVRFSRTIVQQAIDEKKAILCSDALEDSAYGVLDSVAELDLRSIMCVPLVTADKRVLGVLQVDTQNRVKPFNADDLHLLLAVAGQATIALENARLHNDIVQREQMLYAGYVEQEWIKSELELAREVQASFLPHQLPKIEGYEFWAYYEAAVQVGGDFYDCLPLPGGRMAVLIADVSGKAIAAALFMAKAISDTRVALVMNPDRPVDAMLAINRSIYASGLIGRFISMVICILDPKSGTIVLVNAGHFSPLLRKPDGRTMEIAGSDVSGLLLGVSDTANYQSTERQLEPGDCVVFYSDGITEALDSERGAQYGSDRLLTCIAAVGPDPQKLGEAIVRDVRDHAGGYKQSDDMTLLLLHRRA